MNIKNPFKEGDFFPELTPLIDVMFLLLVFFMLTTTFEDKGTHKTISVELPKAKHSQPVSKEGAIVLKVKENGDYFIGDKPCSESSLPEVLKINMDMSKDSVVVISADKNTPYYSLVYIYDVLQAIGVKNFAHEVR